MYCPGPALGLNQVGRLTIVDLDALGVSQDGARVLEVERLTSLARLAGLLVVPRPVPVGTGTTPVGSHGLVCRLDSS